MDGIHGYFRLDTGDDGALTLFDHFFSSHDFPVELPGIRERRVAAPDNREAHAHAKSCDATLRTATSRARDAAWAVARLT